MRRQPAPCPRIAGFRLPALSGLLSGGGAPPFDTVETIGVADPDGSGRDIATPAMQEIAARFQTVADRPLFPTTREIAA